jgi:cell division protein DivIC
MSKLSKGMILVFGVLYFSFLGFQYLKIEQKFIELEERQELLYNQVATLTEQKEDLQEQLKTSQNLETIERIAREKLKMVKPNEYIYVIQDGSKK